MLRVGDVQKNNRVNLLDLVLGHSFIYWYSFVQKVQEKQVDEPHRQVHRCLIFKYYIFQTYSMIYGHCIINLRSILLRLLLQLLLDPFLSG